MALNLHNPFVNAGTGVTAAAVAQMRRYPDTQFTLSVKKQSTHIETEKGVILSAEHHTDTANMLAILLALAGYSVKSVCNIEDALELTAKEEFDLYLVGDLLPHGSSVELTRQIRKFNSKTPLIFHSARAYATDINRGLLAGAQEYLVKPCDTDRLLRTIGCHINQRVAQWM